MDRSLDRHRHYSRKNCLLIDGVKENEKENTGKVRNLRNLRKRNAR